MMSRKSKNWVTSKKAAAEKEDDDSSSLPGWPGYRTSAGRSGLDPIDSQTEAGHVSGVLIRQLFTLQIKTKIQSTSSFWLSLACCWFYPLSL
jgi:hypothetical protein